MAFNAYSARNARVTFNATVLTAKQWTMSVEADDLEITNFESNGYKESIDGIYTGSFTIEADDNGTATLTDLVQPGVYLSSGILKLYLNATAAGVGPYWQVTYPFIKSVSYRADVKGTMSVTIQGHGTAAFVYPTGAPGTTT